MSESRLAATPTASLAIGQVAFLRVTQCTPIGAFVDWGLAKELLVPFAEQTTEMRAGERYAIGLYLDKSGRHAGTMRVAEMLSSGDGKGDFQLDEWVEGEAWRSEPDIGLFVIVQKAFVGLVPKSEPQALSRGEAARLKAFLLRPKAALMASGGDLSPMRSDASRARTSRM